VNYARPQQRLFLGANYTLGRAIDETDSPFGLPASTYNLAAERGPAVNDARHRFMSIANLPLPRRFRLGTSVRVLSALPYNITTGRDDNGDTVSNDRPSGVTRNTGRGSAQIRSRPSTELEHRVWRPGSAARRSQVRIIRGDNGDPLSSMGGGDSQNKRYSVELYTQAYNVLNHVNALNYSGVLGSPFFGHATSAAAPRRIEVGTRFTF